MISQSDISVTVEPSDCYQSQRIQADLRMGVVRFSASDGSVEVEREEERCRAEIWHKLYGDIDWEVHALERVVFQAMGIGANPQPVIDAFRGLHKKLAFQAEVPA